MDHEYRPHKRARSGPSARVKPAKPRARHVARSASSALDVSPERVVLCLVSPFTQLASCSQEAEEWAHYAMGRLALLYGEEGLAHLIGVSPLSWAVPLAPEELVREYFCTQRFDDLERGVFSVGTGFRLGG
jgi:hypothetical protein